jgi:syntaxin-binding protein 1
VLSKAGGPPEKKDVLLEEHDPVWLELRHAHIADVIMVICFVRF